MKRSVQCLLAMLLLADLASAATITVRKDGTGNFTVLQQALSAAADGDSVLIGPGEYTESSMVRLNGYGWDVETFGLITATDLTVIGSGAASTIIGPATYQGAGGTFYSPKGFVHDLSSGTLHLSDLTLRNCYEGLFVNGVLCMDHCRVVDNDVGVFWSLVGSGGWIRDTRIEVAVPILSPKSLSVGFLGGNDVQLERCYFGNKTIVERVQATLRNCEFSWLDLYSGTRTFVFGCSSVTSYVGILMSTGGSSYCEIRDSSLRGQNATLAISQSAPGGRFAVENSRLAGGALGVLYTESGTGACSIHNCDLVKGSGPMVECETSTATVTHDLSNNYWGTIDEATIQSWIIDHADNPSIGATVLYAPFAGQSVPAETTTWGSVKALFR